MEAAEKVGESLKKFKCNLIEYEGCLGLLLSKLNCIGPKGEIRQELCDSANKESAQNGPSHDWPLIPHESGTFTGYRLPEHRAQLYKALQGGMPRSGMFCLENGGCFCKATHKFRDPKWRKGDFFAVCQEERSQYVIIGSGDNLMVYAPGWR